jgi:hypothetical protein
MDVTDEGDPVAVDDGPVDVDEDSTTPTLIDATANDDLTDNAVVTTFDATSTGGGTVVDNGDGTVGYTPLAGFVGPDSFTYEICDDDAPVATCSTATVSVLVADQGTPDAVDDGPITITGESSGNPVDWATNDDLVDDSTLNSFDATSTNGGTVVDNGDGTFGYTPAAGFSGSDSFTYTVCDDDLPTPTCDTATVTLDVIPPWKISGIVWLDLNRNALLESGEDEIPGARLTLTEAGADGAFDTADDADYGEAFTASPYEFTGLANGTYRVVLDYTSLPADLIETFEIDPTLDGVTIVVIDNADVLNVDFGSGPENLPPVYTDETANDEQTMDVGELPEPLTATDADGDPLTFTIVSGDLPNGLTLNSDGTFGGSTITAGVYIVDVDVCDPDGECTTTELTLRIIQDDPDVPVLAFTGRTVRVLATWASLFILAGLMMLVVAAIMRRRDDELVVDEVQEKK